MWSQTGPQCAGMSQPDSAKDASRIETSSGRGEALAKGLSDRFVQCWEEMTVAVERHVDGRVTHLRLDGFRVGPLGDSQGDAGVPEVVEPALHPGALQCRREHGVPKAGRDQGVSSPIGEDKPSSPGIE